MATITLALSERLARYVEERVAAGDFADAEDYLRELIRADEAHLEWLRGEIQAGIDSGVSPLSGREIIDRALARARARCA